MQSLKWWSLAPRFLAAGAIAMASWGLPACSAADQNPAFTSAEDAGIEFALQGEYVGELKGDAAGKYGAQVIALGDGKFRLVLLQGGLPGAGWQRGDGKKEVDGQIQDDGSVAFASEKLNARIRDKKLTVSGSGGEDVGSLEKTTRKSPTLNAKPPEGAVVLFDGSSADAFHNGRMTEDSLLMVGVTSKQEFGDHRLHVEFRTPFMPLSRGQARGNSGVYVQNRYEVQVLDSFGLEGKNNECGGIYSAAEPLVNMCLPPLSWQTYDIEIQSAKFDAEGNKTQDATMTVKHNGVTIHENVTVKLTPGGAKTEAPGRGPVMLQNHGNPVHFRNIWVVEK